MIKKKIKQLRFRWHRDIFEQDSLYRPVLNSLLSFLYNETLARQGINWDDNAIYQYAKEIHKILEVKKVTEGKLIRVGNKNDGGYIMHDSFSQNRIAYSIGIFDDVTWDKEMAEAGYDVYMYDHTIDKLPENNERFHWKKLGICGKGSADVALKTLNEMLNDNGHSKENGMVLKIDVEGCEWEVLESIEEDMLHKFDQILIELHNLTDTTMDEATYKIKCLKKLTRHHEVIHIHGNNNGCCLFSNDLITPRYIEVTLLNRDKYEFAESEDVLPIIIDAPCTDRFPEIELGRWNLR